MEKKAEEVSREELEGLACFFSMSQTRTSSCSRLSNKSSKGESFSLGETFNGDQPIVVEAGEAVEQQDDEEGVHALLGYAARKRPSPAPSRPQSLQGSLRGGDASPRCCAAPAEERRSQALGPLALGVHLLAPDRQSPTSSARGLSDSRRTVSFSLSEEHLEELGRVTGFACSSEGGWHVPDGQDAEWFTMNGALLDDYDFNEQQSLPRVGLPPEEVRRWRVHRPVSAKELVEARAPSPIRATDFPPIFRRPPDRMCQETHYEYFARRCPGKDHSRQAVQRNVEATRRVYHCSPLPEATTTWPSGATTRKPLLSSRRPKAFRSNED